jgi:RND family efflux transporter MFP subunit
MSKLKYILPPVVLALGVVTAVAMIRSRPPAPQRPAETLVPLVRVMEPERQTHRFVVRSEGTVNPRTEIALTVEVGGRVVSVSPSLEEGAFFRKGDVLLTIEALDYEARVETARVSVRQAERRVAEEEALAEVARSEWERVGDGSPTPLNLREPQLAEARALLASAEKQLAQAKRDLERTKVRAPFTGRVRNKTVDAGQFVTRGAPVGNIYSVDYAEIRLPIAPGDIAFVDLPIGYDPDPVAEERPRVLLQVDVGGQTYAWDGYIDRTEGAIDPKTRLFYAVARVKDPYNLENPGSRAPLAVGLFVTAELFGRTVENVILAPRLAMRGVNSLVVVDAEDRLRLRNVDVLRTEGDTVILADGLESGDRICLSVLDAVVDGMAVRTDAIEGSAESEEATS